MAGTSCGPCPASLSSLRTVRASSGGSACGPPQLDGSDCKAFWTQTAAQPPTARAVRPCSASTGAGSFRRRPLTRRVRSASSSSGPPNSR
eukprot:1066300-Alexandrium_andersonii.AAC.1